MLIKSIQDFYAKGIKIVEKKNQDYATKSDPYKNFRYAEYCGVSVERAMLVRISDKFARISNLIDKDKTAVSDESIQDTLLDMANYIAILHAYLEEK